VEGLHGTPRLGEMFEHLFAEHNIEMRDVGRRVAEVEARKVQRAVGLPLPGLVLPPTDLDGISSSGVEDCELLADSPVHLESNPMRLDGRGPSAARLEENSMPEPGYSHGSAPKLEHATMLILARPG
jgi:hypothetical protein